MASNVTKGGEGGLDPIKFIEIHGWCRRIYIWPGSSNFKEAPWAACKTEKWVLSNPQLMSACQGYKILNHSQCQQPQADGKIAFSGWRHLAINFLALEINFDVCCNSSYTVWSNWCGFPFGVTCCYNFLLTLSFFYQGISYSSVCILTTHFISGKIWYSH